MIKMIVNDPIEKRRYIDSYCGTITTQTDFIKKEFRMIDVIANI